MSKLTIYSAVLPIALAAFSAQAQEHNPQEYCNALAIYAETLAAARDEGATLLEVIHKADETPAGRARSDIFTTLALVYTQPYLPPSNEAGNAFELCWATYGE